MKKNLHFLFAVLFNICAMSVSAETTTLDAVVNYDSGIKNVHVDYTTTLADGTVLGFYESVFGSDVIFCGAISTKKELSIPDSIRVKSWYGDDMITLPVKSIGSSYDTSYIDFERAPSVTSLILPKSIEGVYILPSCVTTIHAQGYIENVSTSVLADIDRILVPKETLESYYQNSSWRDHVLINEEGTELLKLTINMTKVGEFAQLLLQQTGNWYKVNELTVVGKLNEDDLNVFKRMRQLTKLDLSKAIIEEIPNDFSQSGGMGLGLLQEVKLPEVNRIGVNAFSYCGKLKSVILPKVNTIGANAFAHCGFVDFSIPEGVTEIGDYAFSQCENLRSIVIPSSVTEISNGCFYGCENLSSVTIPSSVHRIGESAFCQTNITSVILPCVQRIEDYAFSRCEQLKSIVFGEGLTDIDANAFSSCTALTEVDLPSTLKRVYLAFNACSNIKKVTCRAVVPPSHTNFMLSGCDMTDVKLYVPTMSIDKYRASEEWRNFYTILPQTDKVKDLYIYDEVTVSDVSGIASDCSLNLNWVEQKSNYYSSTYKIGSLDYNGDSEFKMSKYQQSHYLVYDYQYAHLTSLIANGQMSADAVSTSLECPNSSVWYFISLPYDTKVSDITYSKDCRFVIRKYSGADRAMQTGDTWKDLTLDSIMHAYEGYILRCSKGNVSFTFPATDNKNNVFAKENVTIPLKEYVGEFEHNRSWNLIGNPYPCYFDSRKMDFMAPFMVWNDDYERYDAYSPLDDDYILRPTQAFFVQRPVDQSSIVFNKEGRQKDDVAKSISVETKSRRAKSVQNREVLNFSLRYGQKEDHTRIVLNEDASRKYELGKDASKFIEGTNGSTLIYSVENGVRYAINERSVDDCIAQLGFYAEDDGEYTIVLNSTQSVPVTLIDNETHAERELNEGYTFNAVKGFSDNRFTLVFGETTGVVQPELARTTIHMANGDVSTDVPCTIYGMDGRVVAVVAAGESISLATGVYIVSSKDVKRKIVVK